ncbi:MAG TPA: hypothetical protein VGR62_15525 [Candidatus Binatia bacterium]|jgi:hypothetical protein|nr:hypothetical protein [Candidatus Binatia bacterium]
MTITRILRLATLLLTVTAPAFACTDARECSTPPSNANPSGAVEDGTYDDVYVGNWASSQSAVSTLWNGLDAEQCDWDEGWGFSQVGNTDFMLTRILNAAWAVKRVEGYTKHTGFGLWRNVNGIVYYNLGRWWEFVSDYGEDEWTPGCEGGNGEHVQNTDEYNVLHMGGYNSTVVNRGSTLVHETVHQDEGHVDEEDCNPDNVSCDLRYGLYNSNTMQINFLHDALVTYETQTVNGTKVRKVSRSGDTCRWIHTFSDEERDQIAARADSNMNRFAQSAWSGWKQSLRDEVAVRQAQGEWNCPACQTSLYTFNPNSCSQPTWACNEVMNPQNVGINGQNRNACNLYNDLLDNPGAGPDTIADAEHAQLLASAACLPPTSAAAAAYCVQRLDVATNVSQLDPCGWMETVHGAEIDNIACAQEFCRRKFEASPWPEGTDPYGCIDYLCGDDTCGGSGTIDGGTCETGFYLAEGDPEWYVPTCSHDGCRADLLECLIPYWQQGQWMPGDENPEVCDAPYTICVIMSSLAGLTWAEYQPLWDPDIVQKLGRPDWVSNPGHYLDQFAARVSQLAKVSTSNQYREAAIRMTGSPERIAAMFHAAPEEFVGMFGNQGFDEIIGPDIAKVTGKPMDASKLTPAGLAALKLFEQMRDTLPAGGIQGAIGTFAPQTAGR